MHKASGDALSYYLDPRYMYNDGPLGCHFDFRATILHTFGGVGTVGPLFNEAVSAGLFFPDFGLHSSLSCGSLLVVFGSYRCHCFDTCKLP